MKALVYHGPGQRAWEDAPDPKIQAPTDVIVRVDSATICGTDLHILKGDVPEVTASPAANKARSRPSVTESASIGSSLTLSRHTGKAAHALRDASDAAHPAAAETG